MSKRPLEESLKELIVVEIDNDGNTFRRSCCSWILDHENGIKLIQCNENDCDVWYCYKYVMEEWGLNEQENYYSRLHNYWPIY